MPTALAGRSAGEERRGEERGGGVRGGESNLWLCHGMTYSSQNVCRVSCHSDQEQGGQFRCSQRPGAVECGAGEWVSYEPLPPLS